MKTVEVSRLSLISGNYHKSTTIGRKKEQLLSKWRKFTSNSAMFLQRLFARKMIGVISSSNIIAQCLYRWYHHIVVPLICHCQKKDWVSSWTKEFAPGRHLQYDCDTFCKLVDFHWETPLGSIVHFPPCQFKVGCLALWLSGCVFNYPPFAGVLIFPF